MRNNIFDYATSELSQDAFICWCVNWFNDDSNPKLKEMSVQIIKELADVDDVKSVSVSKQFTRKVYRGGVEEKGNEIKVKIDVLLVVNGEIVVIVEDKVFTSEHDNQIKRYQEGIKELIIQGKGILEINSREKYRTDVSKVRTVLWKTGFLYDYDRVAIVDLTMDSQKILKLIGPFASESVILEDYVWKIKNEKQWYITHERYWDYSEDYCSSHWDLNVSKHTIAQYRLMREFFPDSLWKKVPGKREEYYQVYDGSSFGRPYTQMVVYNGVYGGKYEYCLFWRIDTNAKAPYLSLRFYEWDPDVKQHKAFWTKMEKAMETLIRGNHLGFDWTNVKPTGRIGDMESDVFHLSFDESLRKNWNTEKETIIQSIRRVNALFLHWIETEGK